MAFLLIELPESYHTVTMPIARQVVRQVAGVVGLDPEIPIHAPGFLGSIPTSDSTLGSNDDQRVGEDGLLGVTVTVDEVVNEDSYFTTPFYQNEIPPVFVDKALNVSFSPVYHDTETTISFNIRFADKTQALRARDHTRNKVFAGQRELKHQASYAYHFPPEILTLIHDIYERREAYGEYGDSWAKYALEHFTKRLKTLTNQSGETQIPAISEKQGDIIGWWDFDLAPDIDPVSQVGGHWVLTFNYMYRYQRPAAISGHYPVIVHQSILPRQWINGLNQPEYPEEEEPVYKPTSRRAMDIFRDAVRRLEKTNGKRLPDWDDWTPATVPPHSATIVTVLTSMDRDDETLLLDLKDLGGPTFSEDILRYMSERCRSVTKRLDHAILVELYKDNNHAPDPEIVVSPDLIVRAKEPLDPRRMYHIRISVLSDLSFLTTRAREDLLKRPGACLEILQALDPNLEEKGLLPMVIGAGRYVVSSQYDKAIAEINRILQKPKLQTETYCGTVNQLLIGAKSHAAG